MSKFSCRTCGYYSYGANGELRCSTSDCWMDQSKYFPKLDACLRTNEKCEICDDAIHDGFDNCPNCGKNLTSFILRYTEQKVSDMLRTLANMIAQDAKKRKGGYSHYVEDLIKFAKNNPTPEEEK